MPNRIRTVVMLGALLVAIGLPWGATAAAPTANARYLALGDSYAAGVGATDQARLGYVAHLGHFFSAPANGGAATIPLARGGETSGSFIDEGQLTRALAVIDNSATDIAVVTLDIGGNDLLELFLEGGVCVRSVDLRCFHAITTVLPTFAHNYTVILRSLRKALAADRDGARLLIATYPNAITRVTPELEELGRFLLLGADGRIDCSVDEAEMGLNDLIACIGRKHGATIVDLHPVFEGKVATYIRAGDVHPNNAGHVAIADAFKTTYRASKRP